MISPIASYQHPINNVNQARKAPIPAQARPKFGDAPAVMRPQPAPSWGDYLAPISGQQILYPGEIAKTQEYIKNQWKNLTISNRQLLDALKDPKVKLLPGEPWRLYISPYEDKKKVEEDLYNTLQPHEYEQVKVEVLPPPNQRNNMRPGLLYLPHPYVVPGGRFKEMYGWDSYFIQQGLLRDNELRMAKNMVDNQLYEIKHYGAILNANRSYYLSRSQLPFISKMVLDVYNKTHDKQWLQQAVPLLENHHQFWTSGEHLIRTGPAAGLSRFFDYGEGPAPEVAEGEIENGKNHYDRLREFYSTHDIKDYNKNEYYNPQTGQLTRLFYKGDRTMRESGFDPSNRFGQFNVDIINYAPVCLNSTLFKMEKDMAQIHQILGDPSKSSQWEQKADTRKGRMNNAMWDNQSGLYLDYNFKTNQRRMYPYGTTFFPLWAGLASPQQAERLMKSALPLLEAPGGLMTSSTKTGNQWDAPFAWAPLQVVAIDGMLNYKNQVPGARENALRVATKFANMVAKEFGEHHEIYEKYDVRRMESDTGNDVSFGYASNEPGFGWTNYAFERCLDVLKEDKIGQDAIKQQQAQQAYSAPQMNFMPMPPLPSPGEMSGSYIPPQIPFNRNPMFPQMTSAY